MVLQVGPVQTVQLEVSASVFPQADVTEARAALPSPEQVGTKEIAACWNYSRVLTDNLQGWKKAG